MFGRFSQRTDPASAPATEVAASMLAPEVEVHVVGTSRYQPALRRAVEQWSAEHYAAPGRRIEGTAFLVREPTNRHDPEAVQVYLGGIGPAGYLSRDDARRYQPRLQRLAREGKLAACDALIIGGREAGYNYGMIVYLPDPGGD
jgi:hypothetical protein